ncbi:LOW QUALITY PROTEIN: uncharacterized protein ACR2FA_000990 [Aphomia sociella]
MNTGDDEPSSGLNGRLRPRKSAVPSPQTTKAIRKTEGKIAPEKSKRTCTPSKATNKPDDLSSKADSSPILYLLCPYCDRKFASKQTLSKHARRMHISTSKQDLDIGCLYCNHSEIDSSEIIRHMVESHHNQYFACLHCNTRFQSATELGEHKLNGCEKQKIPYRNKLRQKATERTKQSQKSLKIDSKDYRNDTKTFTDTHGFNGIVISCELKPSQVHDEADIEDNITTNLILPPSKSLGSTVIEKNAVIILDDIQWNKRIPSNFSFHNTDADQILSRLGVVHRSPRTGESAKRDWFRNVDDSVQKFEKCFDTTFYSKVASNVHENLSKFLDGSFNFNPDPDSTIKTRKSKNSVVINTAEGFPILLAYAQYSRNTFDGYMPRAIAPKHKWKWDSLESDRNPINPDQIKRDSHTNNCIITLVSSLDIWTQLCMRRKYEDKNNYSPLGKKTDKQNAIGKELKEILESREIPITSSNVVKHVSKPISNMEGLEFPASLGLAPSTPKYNMQPAVLSGEWVRPRCYVCCACGAPSYDSRSLSSHIATHHPNAQVQHYEVVGELLLNADIMKHLYVPPSQMYNRTRPLRGFRECTKCKKSITLEDLHQHMLDCAGDNPTVRRKCRYRPFGVRRRRPRLPDNIIRKKMRKDIRTRQTRQKSHMRPRPKNRTEVGDAETIRKMLADLPAKRHRVMVNPMNSTLRPRKKIDKQRTKLLMKRRSSEDPKHRKHRSVKKSNNSQAGSTSNEDHNKTVNNKDDDDKPLKPKLKRVATKSTRQNETLKRRTVINRTKRKLQPIEQNTIIENTDGASTSTRSSSGGQINQMSIDNNPQRIDVNNGSHNTREHSSRGGSNSRDQQRPTSSGESGNSNNSCAPPQNAPLKHSIARLTADSETHDKSVQFHHLFLVQQECNNVNHVPTGDRLFFENEAAVTRLDKPPLHSNQRNVLDPYGLQKSNKLNKPRKGLNDCIAMLKNKLEVPTHCVATSQISVQCGSDDPMDSETAVIHANMSDIEYQHDLIQTKPAEIFSRHNLTLDKTFGYDIQRKYDCKKRSTSPLIITSNEAVSIVAQSVDLSNQTHEKTPKRQQSEVHFKREVSRRRSVTQPISEIPLPKQFESLPSKVATVQKSDEDSTTISNKVNQRQRIDVDIDTYTCNKPMIDCHKNKITPKNVDIHTDSITRTKEPVMSSQYGQNIINKENQVETYMQRQPTPEPQSEIPHRIQHPEHSCVQLQQQSENIIETQSSDQQQIQSQPKQHLSESSQNQMSQPQQKTSGSCLDTNTNQHTVDTNRECNSSSVSNEVYVESEFNRIPSDIPPAHASTNIESLVSVPLDLSGKVSNVESSDNSAKQDNSFTSSNYDDYETLDLSSKNTELTGTVITTTADVVVDLRIKSTPRFSHQSGLGLSSKNVEENVTDLSMRDCEIECVPTDLSIRGKPKSNSYETNERRYGIQDLSSNITVIPIQENTVIDSIVEVPTDLSGKAFKDNISVEAREINYRLTTSNTIINDLHESVSISTDLAEKKDEENQSTTLIESPIITARFNVESGLRKEIKKSCAETVTNPTSRVPDKAAVQKPIYDPTLKIPQYKIRTTTTTTITSTEPIEIATAIQTTKHVDTPLTIVTSAGLSVTETKLQDSMFADTSRTLSVSKERLSYELINNPLKICATAIGATIPIYTLSNPISTTPVSKYESTTPVYTLANACISVTKIDRPVLPLTSSLLSIPGTTIASTTSVYTLAGTTVGGNPINYGATPHLNSQISPSNINNFSLPSFSDDNILGLDKIQKGTHNISPDTTVTTERDFRKSIRAVTTVDQDSETARKIAMLPKELVEILGTMPAGHRNQLLNVLPQYVSNTVTTSMATNESTHITTNTSTTVLKRSSSPTVTSTQIVVEGTASSTHDSYNVIPLNIKPLISLQQSVITCQANSDNKHSKHFATVPTLASSSKSFDVVEISLQRKLDKDTKIEIINVEESEKMQIDQIPGDCTNALINATVIDLTDDDNIMPSTSVVKLAEKFPRNIAVTSQESQAFVSVNKQKVANEKTSSLRAVRIKAPSERHKSISTETSFNKASSDQNIKLKATDQEKEIAKDSDKTMIVQQVEVTSTQFSINACEKKENPVGKLSEAIELRVDDTKYKRIPTTEIVTKEEFVHHSIEDQLNKSEVVDPAILSKNIIFDESVENNSITDNCNSDSINLSSKTENFINETATKHFEDTNVFEDMNSISNNNGNYKCSLTKDLKIQEDITVARKEIILQETIVNRHNEDESDDDISLAVIVKQKQLDQQNSACKDSAHKNAAEKKKSFELQIIAENVQENLTESCLIDDTKETKVEATVDEGKHPKKKTRKSRHKISISEVADQQTERVNENMDDFIKKNTCGIAVEPDENTSMCQEVAMNTIINQENNTLMPFGDKDIVTKNIDIEFKTDKSKKLDIEKEVDLNIKNTESKEKPKKKKKNTFLDSNEQCSLYVSQEDKGTKSISAKVFDQVEYTNCKNDNETTALMHNQLFTVELSDTQDSLTLPVDSSNGAHNDTILEYKKSIRFSSNKKTRKYDTNDTNTNNINDVPQSSEKEDSNITPLRRSRRGKSLFVDSEYSDVDNMILNSDISLEQKTPLTKKQLIFSKLLLDEENTKAPAHSTPEKNIDKDASNIATLSSGVESYNNDIASVSNIMERTRSSKRRQSPQVKQKNKKGNLKKANVQEINTTNLDVLSNVVVDVTTAYERNAVASIGKEDTTVTLLTNEVEEQIVLEGNVNADVNSHKTDFIEMNTESISKVTSSYTEKRKINVNKDINQGSKAKKSKPNIKNNVLERDEKDASSKDKINTKHKVQASGSSEIRTTCYNLPAAARRTRSKSVVVKSSGALLYDPYDIDLDDMLEKTEPVYGKRGKLDDKPVNIFQKISTSKSKNTSSKPHTTILEQQESIHNEIINKSSCQASEASANHIKVDDTKICHNKGNISDSDESSKSDVPLQKYVEEKERRVSELDTNELSCSPIKDLDEDNDIDVSELSSDKCYSDSKKSRRTLAVCNNVDSITVQNEADEQLRSEQFMESFGFFSERKPRKSNLLASKKISETFHIIANETDDMFFGLKERATKKSLQNENRKSVEGESNSRTPQQHPSTRKAAKRGRKKKSCTKTVPRYCNICKKQFRRPDNYLRHQMTLLHISKLSEVEMKIKTIPVHEEPNYLIAYKQYLDRLKILTDKLAKRKKNKAAKKIKLPTVEEILADLNKTIREQQLSERGLSRDEALFLDCCELLKESHKKDLNNTDSTGLANIHSQQASVAGLDLIKKPIHDEKFDSKSDGDVDSITAKNILESEEVRNLENDLISGLKEAANASLNSKIEYRNVITNQNLNSTENHSESFSSAALGESHFNAMRFDVADKSPVIKAKKYPEYKEKMYPDIIEDIDMFEDKFDKIKRKCRSQAAAAKQTQIVAKPSISHKARRKSDKKIKKSSKKKSQSSQVLTKGALKGFDGIKVSIPRSDINMSTIVPPIEISSKKKKKTSSKRKRDKKDSESSSKYDSEHRAKDSTTKKVDVYEFMDNEDAELFEFRPSTLMERFKSISNKELPSTSKFNPAEDELENSSESGSDGDDFVYMSDDYVCSDDETENSLMSCETGNIKVTSDKKNPSQLKRKDVVEKNAVMGKIFKHNAVRTEKKNIKTKDTSKPKANLDQLFDSLLEEEPSSSMLKNSMSPQGKDMTSPKDFDQSNYVPLSVKTYDTQLSPKKDAFISPKKISTPSPHKYDNRVSSSSKKYSTSTTPKEFRFSPKKYDTTSAKKFDTIENMEVFGPSTSKRFECNLLSVNYGPSTSKKYEMVRQRDYKALSPKKHDSSSKKYITSPEHGDSSSNQQDDSSFDKFESKLKSPIRAESDNISMSYEFSTDLLEQSSLDDAGVARQRARRKCAVGKQNVLAESWSSESEPDGRPPRPSSAESVLGVGRKRKGRKKEPQQSSGRKGNNKQVTFKKQDVESRVSSGNRNILSTGAGSCGTCGALSEECSSGDKGTISSGAGSCVSTGVQVSLGPPGLPGPSGLKGRSRSTSYYWTSEGDDEQEHLQQHGWIVGDSHKKLVTMLAHAKGRKRNNDDKRHLVE